MSKARQYIDFRLYLAKNGGDDDQYVVSLLPTPEVGETVEPIPFSIAEGAYNLSLIHI